MIKGVYLSGKDDLQQVYELRHQVFVEELGLRQDLEQDGYDDLSVHALAYEGDVPVATGRMLYDGEIFRVSRVVVDPKYRGQGYGDFVTRMLLNKSILAGAKEIYVSTVQSGQGFFEKIGFQLCGEPYQSGGLTWVPMWIQEHQLHSCCNCKG